MTVLPPASGGPPLGEVAEDSRVGRASPADPTPSVRGFDVQSASPSPLSSQAQWVLGWATRVAEFSFVQCWVQLLTGIAGILIVRTMAKDQYVLYAIANQMQTTCNLLADLGIGIGVRSIGGRVWQDRLRFGGLLNAALGLRRWFALFSIAACLPIAAWMLWKNAGSLATIILLCGVIVASVLPQLAATVLTVVPQLHGEYRRIQILDFSNAMLRLSMIAALAVTQMNALLATAVGAINNWVQMLVARRWVHDHAETTAAPNVADRRELIRLSLRIFPNVLFFCFQGQVTLLILTLVGNRVGIADVTALGRLAMLLTPLSVAFINVLVPRFAACQDPQRLPRLYLLLVAATALALTPILLAGLFAPGPLLWLLGSKYSTLKNECGLIVVTACVGQLVHVLHGLNTSRAWIRTLTTAWIPLTLAIQLLGALALDLKDFNNVLIFQLASASIPIPLLCMDAILGCRRAVRPARLRD
jgi:O-antigen/teichoic acid export membrane protein